MLKENLWKDLQKPWRTIKTTLKRLDQSLPPWMQNMKKYAVGQDCYTGIYPCIPIFF